MGHGGWVGHVADLPGAGDVLTIARDAAVPAGGGGPGSGGGAARIVKQYHRARSWRAYIDELRTGDPFCAAAPPSKYEVFRDGAPPAAPEAVQAAARLLRACDGGAEGDVWLSDAVVADMGALRPCYWIADVDGKHADAQGAGDAAVVQAYLDVFGLRQSDVGSVVQVATARRRDKASLHIKINIVLPHWSAGRAVAAFVADALRARGAPAWFAPDPAIYGARNQLMRALGSCKLLPDGGVADAASVLRPHGRSSADAGYHSGRMHRHNPQRLARTPAPIMALLLQQLSAPPRAAPSRKRPADGADEDRIRVALEESGLAAALGELFDPEDAVLQQLVADEDTARVSCYVDGTLARGGASLRCPFKGGVHTSNRARISLASDHIAYECMAASCRDRAPLRLPLPLPLQLPLPLDQRLDQRLDRRPVVAETGTGEAREARDDRGDATDAVDTRPVAPNTIASAASASAMEG